jgi:hypothetical protein
VGPSLIVSEVAIFCFQACSRCQISSLKRTPIRRDTAQEDNDRRISLKIPSTAPAFDPSNRLSSDLSATIRPSSTMALLPFNVALVPVLLKSPWTEMTCAYLDSFDFVSHVQLANLDAPENRDVVQDALEEIKSNVQGEIREISTEARDVRGFSTVGRTADNTIFTSTRAVRTCVAELARYIFTTAQSAPWKFHKENSDVIHRMVIISIICEVLVDLDNVGGYFNYQLKPKEKASSPQHERTHGESQREESPLFMELYDNDHAVQQDALGGASDLFDDGGASNSIMDIDQAAQDEMLHQRTENASSYGSFLNTARISGSGVLGINGRAETEDRPSVQNKNQNRKMAQLTLSTGRSPVSVPQKSRRLISRTTRDYEVLKANFKLLSRAHESLKRKLANRRRTELNVCQGNCFNDLEEADHRNWEKGQEIDSLKASVAGLQLQVAVLSSAVARRDGNYKEKCDENIRLKARIQELEQQARKGKSVRFAAGTK